ncbi:MAG: hypothetical protein JOZ79_11510 [Sphingomonas sp.]|nr:hypothetical protein [Sphingomonas sp.]
MTNDAAIRCSVERAEKLPAGLNTDTLCATIRGAGGAALNRAGLDPSALSVRITVDSERKLSATATLNGRTLPEHHVGISDRSLNARAVELLATAIAGEVAAVSR